MTQRESVLLERLREVTLALRETRTELETLELDRVEPIAIVGIGCRFPGGAAGPEAFWELLSEGRDAVKPLEPRWALWERRPSEGVPRWAGLLIEAVDEFDAAFFGISPREAQSLDPQHRLLLEVAWEALENAAISPRSLHGSRTGVFVGACSADYRQLVVQQSPDKQDAYGSTGNLLSIAAGRLSYSLGLQGPSLTVDTACSSSLVAVHLACRSLRSRESELALAGGVNLLLSAATMEAAARTQALSPDGRCKTFDASANGFVRGEGCGLVVLKRLADAKRAGDRIWAIIRGSAVNQDGQSTGMTTPNVLAQEALLRDALKDARTEPGSISYIEAHGTGTTLGDPIEVEALRAVVGPPRPEKTSCVLGAVKTNIGHLEGAAGVAGLIKTVLALWNERIPKNLNFRTQNAHLSLDGSALRLASEPVEWHRGNRPRLAGVSSFGLSGTNAHVVVEEAPATEVTPVADERGAELIVLSARSEHALNAQAAKLRGHLQKHPELRLRELSYSLGTARDDMEHRLALVANRREGLMELLESAAQGQTPAEATRGRSRTDGHAKVVFVFPGQGSQWLGMGRELLKQEPVFREAMMACDRAIQVEAGFSVLQELEADEARSEIERIDVVQPLLFAMSVALAAQWRSWGVEPDAVVGHSMGEIAAAQVAGVLSLEDATAVICRRSRLLRRISGKGEMAMVELSMEEAGGEIRGYEQRLSVAVSNSPRSTVLAGEPEALEEVLGKLSTRGVYWRKVKVDVASHSPQVEPLLGELVQRLSGLKPQHAVLAMRSTVTGEKIKGEELAAQYWAENLRRPVRFGDAVKALLESGHGMFVEMSPHPLLVPALQEMLQGGKKEGAAVGSLRRGKKDKEELLAALGQMWVKGYGIKWQRLHPGGGRKVELPTYAWDRQRYWVEAEEGATKDATASRPQAGHPLLGEGRTLSTSTKTRVWETTLDSKRLPWLGDHQVQGAIVFPGAGYIEMALAAAAEVLGPGPFQLTDTEFLDALSLVGSPVVQVVTMEGLPGRLGFQVASREPSGERAFFRTHARGTVQRTESTKGGDRKDLAALQARMAWRDSSQMYAALAEMGLDYGPAFHGLQELWRGQGEALGRAQLPPAAGSSVGYQVHPALLDSCLQVLGGALADRTSESWVPVAVESIRVLSRLAGEVYCHAQLASAETVGETRTADLWVLSKSGTVIAEITGLRVQRLARSTQTETEDSKFLAIEWEAVSVGTPKRMAGRWLLLGDGGELGSALRKSLEAAGQAVVHATAPTWTPTGLREVLTGAFEGMAPQAIVHLESLQEGERWDPLGMCDSALYTVQALGGIGYRDSPRLWLVTRGAQAVGGGDVKVAAAQLLGLGRVIALEHAELRCGRLDLDPAGFDDEAAALVAELMADEAEEEVAWREGQRYVARLVHRAPESGRREKREAAQGRPFILECDKPGVLERLVLREKDRRSPGRGEVEIAVEAAGLNFIDVLKTMGTYPGMEGGPIALGGECAGRVVAIGEGVESLAVGQEVVAVASASLATHVTVDADMVALRPTGLSIEQAAGVPLAFMTAWYGLVQLGRLRAGERVLIHSATGGTGLAAVQVARHLGAEVFATAGTEQKREWLKRQGIAVVMDSRTTEFAREVIERTGGQGVDVVLNSLTGEAIEASLSVLAQEGRFIELGKRDIYADRSIGLAAFKKSLSYSAVDLAGMAKRSPSRFAALFTEIMSMFERGMLKPVPVESVPISRAVEAFRKMAQAHHIGKLVLGLTDPNATIQVAAGLKVNIRKEGSYLVTGGLGGLGLSVAGWLAEKGAGQLVLVGRSGAASAEQKAAVEKIRARGTQVVVEQADVANREQLKRVLEKLRATGKPLRGVIHAAVVLDDGMLMQQTPERFRTVLKPKVMGAMNLHELTQEDAVELFVMYSSGAGLLGSAGQGNYAAANTALDALAYHRRAKGLPALSIDWGAFAEVGLAVAHEIRGERLAARGMRSLTPREGLVALERMLEGDAVQVGVVPLNLRQWVGFNQGAVASPRLGRLWREQRGDVGGDRKLLERLEGAEREERVSVIEGVVREKVAQVLRIPEGKIEREAPLKSLGMDSLMGLELRNLLEGALAIQVPATLLWTYATVAALSEHLAEEIVARGRRQTAQRPGAEQRAEHSEPKSNIEYKVAESDVIEPIAIVGMGCRFPGGAATPDAFWELLDAGRDAVRALEPRWTLWNAQPSEDVPRWAGLLTEAVDEFDAAFFGITPLEAQSLDPQHRLLLEVAWEALENATIPPRTLQGSTTSVFVGACTADYRSIVSRQPDAEQDAYGTTGNMLSLAAGRLSYTLGLHGPSLTVDAACASSLVAVHLACRSLRSRESELALAGGVNLLLSVDTMEAVARTQVLSPDGRCNTFDASANGFVRGEGCGVVVLKRLSDARRDGDRIWGLIRGSAVKHDGRSTGLTAPNVRAQVALLREALKDARVDAAAVGFVETHGTATALGDPIEVEALRTVLGPPRADGANCVLGAVKTNIGHLEGAAGIAALIKAVLALWHERIPKNLHFRALNPHIELGESSLTLATESISWPRSDRARIAGVSAFGMSGTSAHVVVEEAPLGQAQPAAREQGAELVLFSGKSLAAITAQAARLWDYLDGHPELGVGDVSYSLGVMRSDMEHRMALVSLSRAGLLEQLEIAAQDRTPPGGVRGRAIAGSGKIAFLFAGHSAQTLGMGQELHARWPAFRKALDRCMALFEPELELPLREVMWAEPETKASSLLEQPEYAQPALFAVEYSLYELWCSLGVKPDIVAGHGIGELVAACAAGVISLEDAVRMCAARGRLLQELPALDSSSETVEPVQAIVAGDETAVLETTSAFAAMAREVEQGAALELLQAPRLEPLLRKFRQVAEAVTYREPELELVSSVRGALFAETVWDGAHWVQQVRESLRSGNGISALETNEDCWLHVLVRTGWSEVEDVLAASGGLWSGGWPVQVTKLLPAQGQRLVLPTYPFQRQRHWVDVQVSDASPVTMGLHPFLSSVCEVADTNTTIYSGVLDLQKMLWLADHCIGGIPIMPASGFIEPMLWAACKRLGSNRVQIEELRIEQALALRFGHPVDAQLHLQSIDGRLQVAMYSRRRGEHRWEQNAIGQLSLVVEEPNAVPIHPMRSARQQSLQALLGHDFYQTWRQRGNYWGPAFQGIKSLFFDATECVVKIDATVVPRGQRNSGRFVIHPALLEACTQAIAMFALDKSSGPLMAKSIRGVRLFGPFRGDSFWARLQLVDYQPENQLLTADVSISGESGAPLCVLEGMQVEFLESVPRESINPRSWLYQRTWAEVELAPTRATRRGSWIFLRTPEALRPSLTEAMMQRNVQALFYDQMPSPDQLPVEAGKLLGITYLPPGRAIEPVINDTQREPLAGTVAVLQDAIAAVKAVAHIGAGHHPKLFFVTHGRWQLRGDGPDEAIAQAALWGLGLTCAVEHPEIWGGLIDLPAQPSSQRIIDRLVHVLLFENSLQRLAIREDGVHAAYLARLAVPQGREAPHFRPDAAYLITGGLGGLGLKIAAWMVTRGARRLILMGRSGLPTRSRWRQLDPCSTSGRAAAAVLALESRGVSVQVPAVDVADPVALGQYLASYRDEAWPQVAGVIHAASVVELRQVMDVTEESLLMQLRPKVLGALALEQVFAGQPLDFFILISSGSSWIATPQLAAYAAANACLDAIAARQRGRGVQAVSIAWGPWMEDGMAGTATQSEAAGAFAAMNSQYSADSLELLGLLWSGSQACPAVLPIDWRRWRMQFPKLLADPFYKSFAADHATSSVPGLGQADDTVTLERLPVEQRRAYLESRLALMVKQITGLTEVDARAGLNRLGMDSLMGFELKRRIERTWSIAIPVIQPLQGLSVAELASVVTDCVTGVEGASRHWPVLPALCEFRGRDGLTLYGHLSLPPGPGPHPAIVVHTADTGGALDDQGQYVQLHEHAPLVAGGFAVFTVDQRGAPGHGEAYKQQFDLGGQDVEDMLAAADFLGSHPRVDRHRLGILGTSRGAYTALLALERDTGRFRAAVLRMGFYDPLAFIRDEQELRGNDSPLFSRIPDWQQWQALLGSVERTPLNHLDAVKVPLLVIHGVGDLIVKADQPRKLAELARSLGIPVTLHLIPGLGHDTHEENPIWGEVWTRITAFFTRQLKERPVEAP